MLEGLPSHLQDRARLANGISRISEGKPVIVWLKSALRIHENPALEIGMHLAAANDTELLVYQAIDERYPHASLRHHNMLLDGAKDLHNGCKKLGLRYVLHLARADHRQSIMTEFAKSAGCIITDLFPLPPWTDWVTSVANAATCPMLEVDCHCVIPMPMFGKSVDRPFKFRDATKKLRKRLIQQSWPKVECMPRPYTGKLPFEPIDIENQISDVKQRIKLLKNCNIDPTVLPVWGQQGGEVTSLARWQKFLDHNLSGYARRRNNAADPEGVSRLSAAFHYGFLSPMKVAREASALGTKSADKYLDELIIFREHAWHHVASTATPYCSSNLPHWAIESWNNTADDPRPVLLSQHQIEFARSPNQLWNLCQNSLLRHGELHNNLRMTWGKAIPQWSANLEQSLVRAQKYNDKYALDGRDPSSIAGVQWCHGLFDRPFFPSLPVMGVVRKRDLETHASRLDMAKYEQHINRFTNPSGCAIIVGGSRLIDCYVARVLLDNGIDVYHLPGLSPLESTPQQLDDSQLTALPDNLKERLESLIDKLQTSEVSQIAKNLVRGVPKITAKDLHIEPTTDGDKLYLKHHDKKQSIIGFLSTNTAEFTDFEWADSDGFATVKQDLTEDFENGEVIISQLESAIWRAVEYIWPLLALNQTVKYSVQAKLV